MAIKLKDKKIMDHLVMEDLKVLGELLWAFLGQSIINDFLFFTFIFLCSEFRGFGVLGPLYVILLA